MIDFLSVHFVLEDISNKMITLCKIFYVNISRTYLLKDASKKEALK